MESMPACDDTWNNCGAGWVGRTEGGSIDCSKIRVRTVMHAVVAHRLRQRTHRPDLAAKVRTLQGP
jgi:hypothetical protein